MSVQRNLEFTIDENEIIQYSDYVECRNRESRTASILVKRENDRAEWLGKANAPQGQILIQQALHDVGAHSDFHTVHNLLEGFCP